MEAQEDLAGTPGVDVEHRGRRCLLHEDGDRRPGWILDADEVFNASPAHALILEEATWQALERLPAIPLMQAPRAIGPPPSCAAPARPLR